MTLENREALIRFAADYGCKRTAEIGVFDGKFSEVICRIIPVEVHFCVDIWKPSRNHQRQRHLDRAYRDTIERMRPYPAIVLKQSSVEASKAVEDEFLDFVYIDANHTFEDVTNDLNHWYPKVRHLGVVSGHDYGTEAHQLRSVKTAVDKFAEQKKLRIGLTDKGEWAQSWYFIKNG